MDSASDFGSEGCGFKSRSAWWGQTHFQRAPVAGRPPAGVFRPDFSCVVTNSQCGCIVIMPPFGHNQAGPCVYCAPKRDDCCGRLLQLVRRPVQRLRGTCTRGRSYGWELEARLQKTRRLQKTMRHISRCIGWRPGPWPTSTILPWPTPIPPVCPPTKQATILRAPEPQVHPPRSCTLLAPQWSNSST